MLKVTIDLWPHGNRESARELADVEIANVTGDPYRTSQDYAWRIREPASGVDACGWLVDWRGKGACLLLAAVLDEWSSGRELPFDNHGNPASPQSVGGMRPADWWAEHDRLS